MSNIPALQSLQAKVIAGGLLALAMFPPVRLTEKGYAFFRNNNIDLGESPFAVRPRFIFGDYAAHGSVVFGHFVALCLLWSCGLLLTASLASKLTSRCLQRWPGAKTRLHPKNNIPEIVLLVFAAIFGGSFWGIIGVVLAVVAAVALYLIIPASTINR